MCIFFFTNIWHNSGTFIICGMGCINYQNWHKDIHNNKNYNIKNVIIVLINNILSFGEKLFNKRLITA